MTLTDERTRARSRRRAAIALERKGEIVKAVRAYTMAAQLGDLPAGARLQIMQRGENLWHAAAIFEDQGKIPEAIRLYSKAARLGNLSSMLNLANLLGDSVSPPKRAQAIYWYKKGIKGGDSTAALNLATHYKNLGYNRWYLYWLGVAAKMGDRDAKTAVRRLRGIR